MLGNALKRIDHGGHLQPQQPTQLIARDAELGAAAIIGAGHRIGCLRGEHGYEGS